ALVSADGSKYWVELWSGEPPCVAPFRESGAGDKGAAAVAWDALEGPFRDRMQRFLSFEEAR
ncbi:MAG: hypothetical protein ACI9OJ_006026, partial [Myxococcota bacterium]